MKAEHLEILVEEQSMEGFLRELMPRVLGPTISFNVYSYQGKLDLLNKLPDRLRGYASWLPPACRIIVIADRDDDDCRDLKVLMEDAAANAGLRTRSVVGPSGWQVVNRIAVEELEAWYFGDWDAVREEYPLVSATVPQKAAYRNSDDIRGGTWEAFERELRRGGYFQSGLRKTEVARAMGKRIEPARSQSNSFRTFHSAILEAVA